jgi:hypothetical protein
MREGVSGAEGPCAGRQHRNAFRSCERRPAQQLAPAAPAPACTNLVHHHHGVAQGLWSARTAQASKRRHHDGIVLVLGGGQ